MKIMTLNTHSLLEADHDRTLRLFVQGVAKEMPDVIALQEVNQSLAADVADEALLTGYVPAQTEIPVRADNHAAHAARLLREAGIDVSWTYLPVKVGYGRFDEGLAFLSLGREIIHTESFPLSRAVDYDNWKTRKVLGVQVEGLPDWFYTVHMGWWQDEEEPFMVQWKVLNCFVTARRRCAPVWLMGDFNSPAEIRGEGYDYIEDTGWYDTYTRAEAKSGSITVPGEIDGWRGEVEEGLKARHAMRIDQVWCSTPLEILSSRVIFDGGEYPLVSDHYGVLVEAAPRETGEEPICHDLTPEVILDEA